MTRSEILKTRVRNSSLGLVRVGFNGYQAKILPSSTVKHLNPGTLAVIIIRKCPEPIIVDSRLFFNQVLGFALKLGA